MAELADARVCLAALIREHRGKPGCSIRFESHSGHCENDGMSDEPKRKKTWTTWTVRAVYVLGIALCIVNLSQLKANPWIKISIIAAWFCIGAIWSYRLF